MTTVPYIHVDMDHRSFFRCHCSDPNNFLLHLVGGKGTDKAGFLFNASNYTEDELTKEAYNADNIGIAYFPYTGAMLQGKVRAKSTDEYTSPSNTNSLHMYRWRGWYWTTEIKFATETRNDVVLFLDNSSSTLLTATATRASANNIRCVKMDSAK